MRLSRRAQMMLRVAVAVGLAFIYIPLIVIVIYAFNSSKILEWPPPGFTTHWFSQAFKDEAAREAFITSATNFVMPVVRIDGHPVGNGAPGLIASALRRDYHAHAEIA